MSEDDKATLDGSGAVAQNGSRAVGERGVLVEGSVGGDVVTGVKIVIHQGREVAIPDASAIAAHRAVLRERLATEAQRRWGGMGVYIREEGAALPIQASPYQRGALGPRADLLETLKGADRLLVLGEPGAGKSVALERLAWELCNGEQPTVPVLVRLFHYAGTPLASWVRATLQATGHLRLDDDGALAAFLQSGGARCVFLFDGLNEVAPPHRDRLQDELVRWMAAHSRHSVILTSRAQDELWRRVRETVGQAVVVQPITDAQVAAYLEAHLEDKGRALYARLDERLRPLARTPLVLWLIKEAGAQGEAIPGNRGELYGRFVSRMLRRDTDRRMDAEIPERLKRGALAALAYHLSVAQRLTCGREQAERVVGEALAEAGQASAVIGACMRHGLLAGEAERLWFAPHQTVQEYFAALALRERWQAEQQEPALRRWWGQARGQHLLRLAAEDWWAEPFVQLAGLVDDADALARGLARENPWLAWWCVGEGRDVSQKTQMLVEERSIHVLHSEHPRERRRAVEALVRIRSERVIESLLWAAGDQDREISSLAVQALGALGEAVKPRAIAALENEDFWLGVLRYTMAYPDDNLMAQLPLQVFEEVLGFPVIWVPPGPFLMGSDKEHDPQASVDEIPQHTVVLPGYWIGRYPVTVAQFRDFATEQRWADAASLQLPGSHPMVNVSWRDTLSYCRWLRQRTDLPVTLPSEAEWEKAARGMEGQRYPWGDADPTAALCNFGGHEGGTTLVGHYSPQGNSPYGCADMAGNVWEWTRSLYKQYPYAIEDGRENLEAGDHILRVLRGGAFGHYEGCVRCAYRNWDFPYVHLADDGFRVVVAPYL